MADAYPYIDKQTLDLIKYSPLYSPIVAYGSDYNYSSNKLRGKLYQFCYRYIYDTKMKSVFSPYSEVAIPQGEELPNGDFIPDFHLNNYISVQVLKGHHTVDEIEVAYRIGNEGNLYIFDRIKVVHEAGIVSDSEDNVESISGAITGEFYSGNNFISDVGLYGGLDIGVMSVGMIISTSDATLIDWGLNGLYIVNIDVPGKIIYLSETLVAPAGSVNTWRITGNLAIVNSPEESDSSLISIFRNDTVDYAVPTQEAIESFDGVPLTARAMEIIESNRIVVGGPKVGFNNTVINVEATITHTEKPEYLSKFDFSKEYSFLRTFYNGDLVVILFPEIAIEGEYYYINFQFLAINNEVVNISVGYYVEIGGEDVTEDIIQYFVDQFNKYNPVESPHYFTARKETGFSIWSSTTNYIAGQLIKYRLNPSDSYKDYIAIKNPGHRPPSGTISNNAEWNYLCDSSDTGRIFTLLTSHAGDINNDLYFISSYSAAIYTSQDTFSIFKYGHKVNVGIEYTDYAGRLSAVNKNDQMGINIPALYTVKSEIGAEPLNYNNLINSIELHIKNRPPIDAYAYRILIDRNIPWFFQFFFYGLGHDKPDITDDNIHWRINVNRAIQNLRDYFPKATLSPYIFEKGDRLRLIAYSGVNPDDESERNRLKNILDFSPTTQNRWRKFQELIDVEIIGYDYPLESETYMKDDGDGTPGSEDYILDGDGNKIREVSTGYIITEKFPISIPLEYSMYILYEIYRPRKVSDENTFYWETSKTFDIGNPGEEGRYHKGDTDQDPNNLSTVPAEITLHGGNVYRKMRYSGEADIYFPVESMSLSDFYESNAISIGRSNVVSEDLGQLDEENAYMWSDILLEDTAINRLNKFPSGNKDRLQSKHGAISALKEKGFILYAWQTNKVTSIYIGRSSMVDPSDGSERVNLISKSVFGTVRPANSEYGCVDPKSISDSQVHVYFWDGNNSKWCRIAYNGVFPVSDYGMSKFYNDLNSLMKQTSNKHSISVYDNKHDELVVSHKYMAANDYTLSVVGQYVIGDNKLTGIGRIGGDVIASLEEGMILTQLTSAEVTPEINLSILKIDIANRIIYLDQVIPFGVGIAGPVELTAQIIKKNVYKTIAFHEPVNGWKTRYPFPPELMVAYGDQMLSFLNGRAYLHDSNIVPPNFFYGIQFEQYFQFVFNADASAIKLLEGIEYIANIGGWGAIAKGDITIKSFDARGMDMESKLPAAKFRNVEGKWVSELLRDMNTPGIANENYALTDGRFLRGQAGVIKFTTFEVVKTVFYEVSIYFNQSL